MKRAGVFAAAAATYVLAAWAVAPGFYEGWALPNPYNWTCPPPQAGANSKPSSGRLAIKVVNGVSDANAAYTDDGQIVIGFLPGAFDSGSASPITVSIVPTKTCPQPKGVRFVTNIYQVTASASLVKDANITMLYSNLEPDPSAIYYATTPDGPWTSRRSTTVTALDDLDEDSTVRVLRGGISAFQRLGTDHRRAGAARHRRGADRDRGPRRPASRSREATR